MKKNKLRLAAILGCFITSFSLTLGVSSINKNVEKPNTINNVVIEERVKLKGYVFESNVDKLKKQQEQIEQYKIKKQQEELARKQEEHKKKEEAKKREEYSSKFSYEDRYLLAKVCLAEAEDQTIYGQRLVIDTILNRIDSKKYPNTVHGVVNQPYQFTVMRNGRINKVKVTDEVMKLVDEEIANRKNDKVIYFRMDRYSDYGTPMFVEQDHYFSGF